MYNQLWRVCKSIKKRNETIWERRAANEAHRCEWKGCFKQRDGFSKYCKTHHQHNYFHGHPLGYHITLGAYKEETREVKEFMARHRDHPTLVAAIEWVDKWLARSCISETPARKDMRRLHDYGVTGEQIIRAFLPLWLYSARYPGSLPDDARLTFAIGNVILRLAPSDTYEAYSPTAKKMVSHCRAYKKTAKEEIGKTIREYLGTFALLAIREITGRIKKESALIEQTKKGFTTDDEEAKT